MFLKVTLTGTCLAKLFWYANTSEQLVYSTFGTKFSITHKSDFTMSRTNATLPAWLGHLTQSESSWDQHILPSGHLCWVEQHSVLLVDTWVEVLFHFLSSKYSCYMQILFYWDSDIIPLGNTRKKFCKTQWVSFSSQVLALFQLKHGMSNIKG